MRIWLVRHGESLGNVDESTWSTTPDHLIPLTEFGGEQATYAATLISDYYAAQADKKLHLWFSPFLRTEQTKNCIAKTLGGFIKNFDDGESAREDERLREQDFGMFSLLTKDQQFQHYPLEAKQFYHISDHKGRHWAKAPGGESRADVTLRVGDFISTIMRDAEKGQEDMVLVTHGVSMRAFEKRFMHRTVNWFEDEPNPGNGDVQLIEGSREKGYTVSKFKGLQRTPGQPASYKNKAMA